MKDAFEETGKTGFMLPARRWHVFTCCQRPVNVTSC